MLGVNQCCGVKTDPMFSAGHFSLLFSDQGWWGRWLHDCSYHQLQSKAMQHFNERNLPQLRSPRVSHDNVFDVHFLAFPLLILLSICIWRKRSIHRELKHLRQRETLYMKVERITYALGVSLKSPKHANFPRFFPQNIVDRINYSFVNVYLLQKQGWHGPWCRQTVPAVTPRSQCPQWKLELLFWSDQNHPPAWIK